MNRPAVLLLDEPLGALDLKLRKQLQVELKRIQRDVGITFIYVTHDQEEALTMSDRIAVMNRGVVEQVDRPRDGLRAPRDHLRRRLHRRLEPDAGRGRLGQRRGRASCASTPGRRSHARIAAAPTTGERAHAVVRPEKLVLQRPASDSATGDRPSVEGQVESSLYLGTATQMVVRLGDGTRMTVLVPNADAEARRDLPAAGDAARLSWSDENIHIVREGRAPTSDRRVTKIWRRRVRATAAEPADAPAASCSAAPPAR